MKNEHLKNELINHHILAIPRAFPVIHKVAFHIFCGQKLQNIITLYIFYLHFSVWSFRNIIVGTCEVSWDTVEGAKFPIF